MDVIPRTACKPGALGMFVRGVVVHNHVLVQISRNAVIQPPAKG